MRRKREQVVIISFIFNVYICALFLNFCFIKKDKLSENRRRPCRRRRAFGGRRRQRQTAEAAEGGATRSTRIQDSAAEEGTRGRGLQAAAGPIKDLETLMMISVTVADCGS